MQLVQSACSYHATSSQSVVTMQLDMKDPATVLTLYLELCSLWHFGCSKQDPPRGVGLCLLAMAALAPVQQL